MCKGIVVCITEGVCIIEVAFVMNFGQSGTKCAVHNGGVSIS